MKDRRHLRIQSNLLEEFFPHFPILKLRNLKKDYQI